MAELIAGLTGWAPLSLRLILGLIFLIHGLPKLKDTAKAVEGFKHMRAPFAKIAAPYTAVAEFFGGIFLLLGLLTRVAAVALAIVMLGAIFTNKFRQRKKFKGGTELEWLLLAVLVALFFIGAGELSLDVLIGWGMG